MSNIWVLSGAASQDNQITDLILFPLPLPNFYCLCIRVKTIDFFEYTWKSLFLSLNITIKEVMNFSKKCQILTRNHWNWVWKVNKIVFPIWHY